MSALRTVPGILASFAFAAALACGDTGASGDDELGGSEGESTGTAASESGSDSGDATGTDTTSETGTDTGAPEPASFVVVTFNTGTTDGLAHDSDGDGYGDEQVQISDEFYGNGLAWLEAVAAAQDFFAETQPDIVAFQEIFYSEDCVDVPADQQAGFVCETWSPGDPTVAALVLGGDYQIACQLEKPDKCAAVKKDFGSFVGCDQDLCLDFLDGAPIPDCGGGSRVGRGLIELADGGGEITVVSYHGTSGISPEDASCRVAQVEQIFEDLDGAPAANGARNLILGDLNTDPYRLGDFDPSATRWLDFVGEGLPFWFVTEAGEDATPTYMGVNIDHVISDAFEGECVVPGVTQGVPAIYENVYFDHKPHVCTVSAVDG